MHLPAVNPARTTCRQPRDISNLSPYRQRHTQSTWNSSFSQISHLSLFPKTISDDYIQPFDESSADWRSGEPNNKRYAQPSSAVCLSFILQFPAQVLYTGTKWKPKTNFLSLFQFLCSIPLFSHSLFVRGAYNTVPLQVPWILRVVRFTGQQVRLPFGEKTTLILFLFKKCIYIEIQKENYLYFSFFSLPLQSRTKQLYATHLA